MKRFFVRGTLGTDFKLSGAEHNHLATVLRTRTGENVIVCNGDEFDYVYMTEQISKRETTLKFIKKYPNSCNPRVKITVFLAIIKPDCLAFAVQKLNEIGASELVLFNAEHSNAKNINIEKLQYIAEQSSKQCQRSMPLDVRKVDDLFGELNNFDNVFWADESARNMSQKPLKVGKKTAIIIGPEGGFSSKEHDILCNMSNIQHIMLGSRILRAETAAIVATTLVLNKMGEI